MTSNKKPRPAYRRAGLFICKNYLDYLATVNLQAIPLPAVVVTE